MAATHVLRTSAAAGLLALAIAGPATASESAAIYRMRCDLFGFDCHPVRCEDRGKRCVRVEANSGRLDVERSAYLYWSCEEDGCRWTYHIGPGHPRDFRVWDDEF